MVSNSGIMVVVEFEKGKVKDISEELVSKACELAKELGREDVSAVAIGYDCDKELAGLGQFGCKRVYYVDDKKLSDFTSVPYSKLITGIIKKYEPKVVLFGATVMGRDLAPRVASALKCGLTADCTELKIGDYKFGKKNYKNILMQIRPAFGGNIIATIVSPETSPSMATVREGVMRKNITNPLCKSEIIHEQNFLSESDYLTSIIESIEKEKAVDLKSANIIVSAGMGASSPGALALVKKLAKKLGGKVGSSRPVVDSGLLTKERQVGQTGITVRPNLYIACGISGQIQHCAGMAEAKRIIAINSDSEAPIFKIANYGIVGTVEDVIVKMLKAV